MGEKLADRFEEYAATDYADSSPLYRHLSHGIASDDELLGLVGDADRTASPHRLFAAVHFLLFEEQSSKLAEYYPTFSSRALPIDERTYDVFRQFCLDHESRIRDLLERRQVQTNCVGRSAILLPVFQYIEQAAASPLGIVDIGCSAGLNLCWHSYSFDYGDGNLYGDSSSPLRLTCDSRGDSDLPVDGPVNPPGTRIGIDISPLDISDEHDLRWLKAQIWPEHTERRENLQNAIDAIGGDLPTIFEGDAAEVLGDVATRIPAAETLCIVNSHVLYQLDEAQLRELQEQLRAIAKERELFWVCCEFSRWHMEPIVHLRYYSGGDRRMELVAAYGIHGQWIEWSGNTPAVGR